MKDTDAAYIAGIIDGEGCLLLNVGGRTYPVVRIVMSDRPTLEWIAEHAGELVRDHPTRPPSVKELWRVQFNGEAALHLLRAVRPYLVTKADRADELLAWRSTRKEAA